MAVARDYAQVFHARERLKEQVRRFNRIHFVILTMDDERWHGYQVNPFNGIHHE
jgi:hypothetical protein